jgi:hypothetical protein
MKRPSKEELEKLYAEKYYTLQEVGIKYGVNLNTVSRWLKYYGIHSRKRCNYVDVLSKEVAHDMYVNKKMSCAKIGKVFGIDSVRIYTLLLEFGIKLRTKKEASLKGESHPRWKGGWHNHCGYKIITFNCKRMYEHRHIMEQHLGRKLLKDEVIHHINGNKSDNRIENLQIMNPKQHFKESGLQMKNWQALKKENSDLIKEIDSIRLRYDKLLLKYKILKDNI